jgi:hypothetical protein
LLLFSTTLSDYNPFPQHFQISANVIRFQQHFVVFSTTLSDYNPFLQHFFSNFNLVLGATPSAQ